MSADGDAQRATFNDLIRTEKPGQVEKQSQDRERLFGPERGPAEPNPNDERTDDDE